MRKFAKTLEKMQTVCIMLQVTLKVCTRFAYMTTTVNVDKLVLYKYNYDKKNKQIVCAKCYAEKVGSGNLYTVQEAAGRKHLTEIKKEDIDDISKSFGTPLYLTEKKDELAIKHFRWACEMKIQEAKEEMNRYIEFKKGITEVNDI